MYEDLVLDLSMSSRMRPPTKRSALTLDLNAATSGAPTSTLSNNGKGAKRAKTNNGSAAPILTTPDVQMLKLSSPELAKFLNQNQVY